LNKQWLASEVVDGQVYWFDPSGSAVDHPSSLFLLPALDEWSIAYSGNSFFKPMLIIDGQISGTWTALLGKDTLTIDIATPVTMDSVLRDAIQQQMGRYGVFLGKRLGDATQF